ncbi:MAG: hypothetical protein AB7Q27_29280 [Acidimicrobiia bacterium]
MRVSQEVFLTRMRARRLERIVRAQWMRVWWPGWSAPWGAQLGRRCRITIEPGASVTLGRATEVDDGVTIAAFGTGRVELGDGCFVGHHTTIAARELVKIGAGSFLAELVSVRDHDHDPDLPPGSGAVRVAPVLISEQVWVAAKATVVRGVCVGERSVVAAHAVVRNDVPPHSVVAGVPAKVVRQQLETDG